VVIDNLDVARAAVLPFEADTPLIVDPDAVLAPAITPERFKPVRRRDAQVVEYGGGIEHAQLASGGLLDSSSQPARVLAAPDLLRFPVGETRITLEL